MATVVDPNEPIDYSSAVTPSSYVCGECGKSGVKLWRSTALTGQTLVCADCAAAEQDKDISTMDETGTYTYLLDRIDTIGWRVPAIPTKENDAFWDHTSAPADGYNWWRRLPLR